MDYWGGRCPLTGITEPGLLRASHIVPWANCTDEQRLDVTQVRIADLLAVASQNPDVSAI
jgi:hypothetical protein